MSTNLIKMKFKAIQDLIGRKEKPVEKEIIGAFKQGYGGKVKSGKTLSFDGKTLIDKNEEDMR